MTTRPQDPLGTPRAPGFEKIAGWIGRLMVAALFWYSAFFDMAANWPAVADGVAARGLPAPGLLGAAALMLELAAPVALFVPRLERLAMALLALYCLFTAVLFHGFWQLPQAAQLDASFHFFKTVALAGALMMADVAPVAEEAAR